MLYSQTPKVVILLWYARLKCPKTPYADYCSLIVRIVGRVWHVSTPTHACAVIDGTRVPPCMIFSLSRLHDGARNAAATAVIGADAAALAALRLDDGAGS